MRILLLLPILLSSATLVACGAGEPEVAGNAGNSEATARTAQQADVLDTPCQIFSEEEIRSAFGIAAEVELRVKDSRSAFPACSYEWGEDLVVRTIKAGGREIEVGEPAQAMLVVARGVSAGGFEISTSVYKDAEDVAGIGEKARWGASMSQLSFLHGGNLYHVHVKASSDAEQNRALAVGLAERLIAKG